MIQEAFGQKFQKLRKERGLSQEKFSLLIDMIGRTMPPWRPESATSPL